jgi:hypothetical protein
MPYQRAPGVSGNNLAFKDLKAFQRWAIRYAKFGIPFDEYRVSARASARDDRQLDLALPTVAAAA